MTYLDSLITPANVQRANDNPAVLALIYPLCTRFTVNGARHDDSVSALAFTAVSIFLGFDQATDETRFPTEAEEEVRLKGFDGSDDDRARVSVGLAKRMIKAAIQRDRLTVDSQSRVSFDPSDPATGTMIETLSAPWSSDVAFGPMISLSPDVLPAHSAGRPDTITRTNVNDLEAFALDAALIIGADPAIIGAIMTPAESRKGNTDSPVLRAAGLPDKGKARAASMIKLRKTRRALSVAGARSVSFHTVDPQHGARAVWTAETIKLADGSPENRYFAPGTHATGNVREAQSHAGYIGPVTVMTPAGWVAPAFRASIPTQLVRTAPELSGGGFPIGRGASLGIKVPARKRKAAGQTGPTVPENLRSAVETYPQVPTQRERAEELTRLTAALS